MGHLLIPCSNTPMCIYTITNRNSGKVYVGQTTRLAGGRWYKHVWAKEGSAISAAIRKHGIETFDFAVIDNAENVDQLNHKERFWVRYFNSMSPNGYNLLDGGKNRVPSAETRRKQSLAKLGKKPSQEHVEKQTAAIRAAYAKKPKKEKPQKVYVDRSSPEFRQKMADAKRGKRPASRAINKTNRTGKSGVFFRESHGSAGAYSAHVMIGEKMKSRTFGCLKRGKEEAFQLACEWRSEMERVAGYFAEGKK